MTRFHLFAAVLVFAADGRLLGADQSSWELSPYKIHLLVAMEDGGPLSPHVAAELPGDLAARLASGAKGAWQIESQVASPALRHLMLADIASVTSADLPEEARAADKTILVAISRHSGRLRIEARELDVATGFWNALVRREVAQAGGLLSAAQKAAVAAFAPLGRIESADGGVATLKLRAGAFLGRDSSPAVVAGAVFRPVVVKSSAGKVQPGSGESIPWAVLTATSASGMTLSCRVDSGLAGNAIPEYHPSRPRWALGIALPQSSTRLRLVSASDATLPLEGCDVFAQSGNQPAGAAESEKIGSSDASGRVIIPAGSAPVRMLQIRQGEIVLARVPLIPGLAEELTLALPDDRQRIAVELSLAEIEDEVLDLAARREALITRAKAALNAGEISAAAKLKDQLTALPGPESLSSRLDQAAKALKSASPPTQAALQPRLDALRKALEQLAADKPLDRLAEPKDGEAKPETGSSEAGDKKS